MLPGGKSRAGQSESYWTKRMDMAGLWGTGSQFCGSLAEVGADGPGAGVGTGIWAGWKSPGDLK